MKGMRPISEQEYKKALAGAYCIRDKALLIAGVHTGFRISELLSLKVKDVMSSDGEILERVYLERKNTKGKLEGRSLPLHQDLRSILSVLVSTLEKHENSYLFSSRKGLNQPISRRQAWFILKSVFLKAGLKGKLGTHSMRKTFANKIYEKVKHDLLKTKQALGHKNINSTISYLSFRQEDVDEAILAI